MVRSYFTDTANENRHISNFNEDFETILS